MHLAWSRTARECWWPVRSLNYRHSIHQLQHLLLLPTPKPRSIITISFGTILLLTLRHCSHPSPTRQINATQWAHRLDDPLLFLRLSGSLQSQLSRLDHQTCQSASICLGASNTATCTEERTHTALDWPITGKVWHRKSFAEHYLPHRTCL